VHTIGLLILVNPGLLGKKTFSELTKKTQLDLLLRTRRKDSS